MLNDGISAMAHVRPRFTSVFRRAAAFAATKKGVTLDATACWEAVRARDARFDGRFFTGVVSTGVFCRPVCPARTPLRRNCRFFASAAAALGKGFRPCLRCRPETAPGAAAWNGTSAAARALRLIEEGALTAGRWRRWRCASGWANASFKHFVEAFGATPAAVAQARRALLVRKLLGETAPAADVAMARLRQSAALSRDGRQGGSPSARVGGRHPAPAGVPAAL